MENKLVMSPKDYYMTSFGLKIENTTEDMIIEVVLPTEAKIYPMEIINEPAPP